MIEQKWIVENGIGHWVVTLDGISITCDENELKETIEELSIYATEKEN